MFVSHNHEDHIDLISLVQHKCIYKSFTESSWLKRVLFIPRELGHFSAISKVFEANYSVTTIQWLTVFEVVNDKAFNLIDNSKLAGFQQAEHLR